MTRAPRCRAASVKGPVPQPTSRTPQARERSSAQQLVEDDIETPLEVVLVHQRIETRRRWCRRSARERSRRDCRQAFAAPHPVSSRMTKLGRFRLERNSRPRYSPRIPRVRSWMPPSSDRRPDGRGPAGHDAARRQPDDHDIDKIQQRCDGHGHADRDRQPQRHDGKAHEAVERELHHLPPRVAGSAGDTRRRDERYVRGLVPEVRAGGLSGRAGGPRSAAPRRRPDVRAAGSRRSPAGTSTPESACRTR